MVRHKVQLIKILHYRRVIHKRYFEGIMINIIGPYLPQAGGDGLLGE
jgi:hypothetical protein